MTMNFAQTNENMPPITSLKRSMLKEYKNSAEKVGSTELVLDSFQSEKIMIAYKKESKDHVRFISEYLTLPCESFLVNKYCPNQKNCWYFHMKWQKRRKPVAKNTLLQRDTLCSSTAKQIKCHLGDKCGQCHNFEELSYHPARFKSIICNNTQTCKGINICAYAHSISDRRTELVVYKFASTLRIKNEKHKQYDKNKKINVYDQQNLNHIYESNMINDKINKNYDVNKIEYDPSLQSQIVRPSHQQQHLDLEKFKTEICPNLNINHNHKHCLQYHCEIDRRRSPVSQSTEPCPVMFNLKEYEQERSTKCPYGHKCPYSHNRIEQLYHPSKYKMRFCSYKQNNIKFCEQDAQCSFAHSDAEIKIDLIHRQQKNQEFQIRYYKTAQCPWIDEHEKSSCPQAHNWQEFRRKLTIFNYTAIQCKNWNVYWIQIYADGGCENGVNCKYCHGIKELEYHPDYYKTQLCPVTGVCPRIGQDCPYKHQHEIEVSNIIYESKNEQKANEEEYSDEKSPNLPNQSYQSDKRYGDTDNSINYSAISLNNTTNDQQIIEKLNNLPNSINALVTPNYRYLSNPIISNKKQGYHSVPCSPYTYYGSDLNKLKSVGGAPGFNKLQTETDFINEFETFSLEPTSEKNQNAQTKKYDFTTSFESESNREINKMTICQNRNSLGNKKSINELNSNELNILQEGIDNDTKKQILNDNNLKTFCNKIENRIDNFQNRMIKANITWEKIDTLNIHSLKSMGFDIKEICLILPYISDIKNRKEVSNMFNEEIDLFCNNPIKNN